MGVILNDEGTNKSRRIEWATDWTRRSMGIVMGKLGLLPTVLYLVFEQRDSG